MALKNIRVGVIGYFMLSSIWMMWIIPAKVEKDKSSLTCRGCETDKRQQTFLRNKNNEILFFIKLEETSFWKLKHSKYLNTFFIILTPLFISLSLLSPIVI